MSTSTDQKGKKRDATASQTRGALASICSYHTPSPEANAPDALENVSTDSLVSYSPSRSGNLSPVPVEPYSKEEKVTGEEAKKHRRRSKDKDRNKRKRKSRSQSPTESHGHRKKRRHHRHSESPKEKEKEKEKNSRRHSSSKKSKRHHRKEESSRAPRRVPKSYRTPTPEVDYYHRSSTPDSDRWASPHRGRAWHGEDADDMSS